MSRRLLIIFLSVLGGAAAAAVASVAAASPFSFADADLKLAWEESSETFVAPSFEDYLAAETEAFEKEVPSLFEAGAPAPGGKEISPFVPRSEEGPTRSFTELQASGGTGGRVELAGFQGWEVNFLDAAASFSESRASSGDGLFDNNFLRADAGVAFSDQAGTTVGFAADYEGDAARYRAAGNLPTARLGDSTAHSGEGAAGFRSNLWGKAKFATKVSGTFSEGDYRPGKAVDQAITADSTYDFFWLGENLSRCHFTLNQENLNVYGEEQGLLFGRLGLENGFPIADRLYLSGGFGGYLLRSDAPEFRVYPLGRLQLRLTSSWGYFVNYDPRLRVPTFRELFMRRDYVVPTSFRPTEDESFGVRSGFSYNFRDVGRITAAAYERRYKRTYAVTDTADPGAAAYFDPGRVRIRGGDVFYRLTLARLEHYGGAEYKKAELLNAPHDHFPYLPSYEGSAGLTVKFGPGHAASVEVRFLGERYAEPAAPAPLAAAWIPAANVVVRLRPGISATAAAENFTDRPYYDVGGIEAPGRTFRLGMNLVL
jgi:hypothetical protein